MIEVLHKLIQALKDDSTRDVYSTSNLLLAGLLLAALVFGFVVEVKRVKKLKRAGKLPAQIRVSNSELFTLIFVTLFRIAVYSILRRILEPMGSKYPGERR